MKPLCLLENATPYIDKLFKKQEIENIRYGEFIKEVEEGHIKKLLWMMVRNFCFKTIKRKYLK